MLETTFHTDDGDVRITDCMPLRGSTVDIVREVEGLSGRVPMHMELVIRFDYGSIVPWVYGSDAGLRAVAGPDALVLQTPVRTHGAGRTHGRRLRGGGGRAGCRSSWRTTSRT